jgi:hypothetical protein
VPDQLALVFRGGGLSTGDDFGSIFILNTGASPCLLSGSLSVTALDAERKPIPGASGVGSVPISPAFSLTAHTAMWPELHSPPAGVTAASVFFGGDENDNPTNGQSCTSQEEVYPSYWQVEVAGGSWDVANDDPGAATPGSVPRIFGCLGGFLNLDVGPISTAANSPTDR